MLKYSSITIIYNPHSTGPGKAMASDCAKALRGVLPSVAVTVTPTTHAGHAEELAYEIATAERRPLIISASGDGGYNEVVNGAMRAIAEGHQPLLGLLPAGNANDHYHSLHQADLVARIAQGAYQEIDILRLRAEQGASPLVRYAHSYIGFGLSPQVGKRLTRAKLNKFNELWLTLSTLLRAPHTELEVAGQLGQYDNFIISNIPRMAKVLNFSHSSRSNDGRFEVTAHRYEGRARMFLHLFQASGVGLASPETHTTLALRTVRPTSVQADGEVITLDAPADITITSLRQALRCFV